MYPGLCVRNAVCGPPSTTLALGNHGAQEGVGTSGSGGYLKNAAWAQTPPAASSGMKLSVSGLSHPMKGKGSGSSGNGLQIYKLGCCKEKRTIFSLCWQMEGTGNIKGPPEKAGESPSPVLLKGG